LVACGLVIGGLVIGGLVIGRLINGRLINGGLVIRGLVTGVLLLVAIVEFRGSLMNTERGEIFLAMINHHFCIHFFVSGF
jgi:hypothetical protein